MPSELPRFFLARHGDTAWTDSRQRTGRTDIPLNSVGEDRARQFGERLRRFSFASVFTSPLQRASRTCELAGFGAVATVDSDLVEWDYADRIIARVMGIEGDVLAFSSGHIIRMIAARWLGLPPGAGRFFYCRPASVGVLAFEHKRRAEAIISVWNQVAHPRE
jgi:broad specificity phosphatase PhoE